MDGMIYEPHSKREYQTSFRQGCRCEVHSPGILQIGQTCYIDINVELQTSSLVLDINTHNADILYGVV